ncbi:MAG TPA: hypothetical protein VGC07_10000 [Granulicella sp.]
MRLPVVAREEPHGLAVNALWKEQQAQAMQKRIASRVDAVANCGRDEVDEFRNSMHSNSTETIVLFRLSCSA